MWEKEGGSDTELLDGPTWVFLRIIYKSRNCIICLSDIICVFLFPSRGERTEGGAESSNSEPPGGNQLYSEMQFFYYSVPSAVVPTESWWWTHQSILLDFRVKAGWKVKLHNKF